MALYPYKFEPIYFEKIWGGRSLERLFGRSLSAGSKVGESWELADLPEGTSVISNGPEAGTTLTDLTRRLGSDLLGGATPQANGRFPLLLKLLDANDILSLQVHPDADAVEQIGSEAVLKTECWYTVESRDGWIYKGVKAGVSPEQFRRAVKTNRVEDCVRRVDLAEGDFNYLPAGIVHAIGPGVVVAEVQTPSDTTYRVTDWGRGRQVHVERSMQCIRFDLTGDEPPGTDGQTLLVTDYFTVARRSGGEGSQTPLPAGRCTALMMISAERPAAVCHAGDVETRTPLAAGDTILLPAGLLEARLVSSGPSAWLEITLPEK